MNKQRYTYIRGVMYATRYYMGGPLGLADKIQYYEIFGTYLLIVYLKLKFDGGPCIFFPRWNLETLYPPENLKTEQIREVVSEQWSHSGRRGSILVISTCIPFDFYMCILF